MQSSDLLKLLQHKTLSLPDLQKRDAALAESLTAELRENLRQQVIAALPPANTALRARVEKVDLRGVALDAVLSRIIDAVGDAADELLRLLGIDRRGRKGDGGGGPITVIDPSRPITENPEAAKLLEKAKLLQVVAMARLDTSIADRIAGDVIGPGGVSDSSLGRLVDARKMSAEQATTLGEVVTIYQLVDEDAGLTAAIRSGGVAPILNRDASARQLAALSASGWKEFIDRHELAPPPNMTREQWGSRLAERFAVFAPDAAFMQRLPRIDDQAMTRVGEMQIVFERNPKALERDFASLDLSGLSAEQVQRLGAAHEELRSTARAYPGLRLAEVFQDPSKAPFERAAIAQRRVSLVERAYAGLGEGELLELNLSPDSDDVGKLHLDQLGASDEEARMVVSTIKAYQRTHALTNDVDDAQQLLQHGYASATQIGTQTLAHFQATAGVEKAEEYWRDARGKLIDSTLAIGSIIDLQYGFFGDITFGNLQPSARDFLRKLDGYESFFGSLAFCTCDHCQSILGPAAYFVDLMYFLDEHIAPQFSALPSHPLRLKARRPDLWTLELTCDNTNTRIPTLEIVNEILENSVAKRRGYAGSLSDRPAVQKKVYEETLADAADSFGQPFHLPLARIGLYLAKLESSCAAVARALGGNAAAVTSAELVLSTSELALITQRELDLADLSRLYDVTFTASGGGVAAIDAQELVHGIGVTREQLGELLATRFVAAGGASVTIRAEKRGPESVQNDIEKVHGLDADALDRIHRLARLWRKVPWTIPEVDRVLTALGDSLLDPIGVAAFRALQLRLGTSVDETAALLADIPRLPDKASLFDRIFNPPGTADADRFPNAATRFVHPAFRTNTVVPPDPALPRLLAGLGVDLDTLATLARKLAAFLDAGGTATLDPAAANENDRFFLLTTRNLSVIYRHARLARLLGVSVDELFQLIDFAAIGGGVTNATGLRALLDTHGWWKTTDYRLDDIAVATGRPPRDNAPYIDPAALAATIVAGTVETLTFRDTVFAAALGVTEQASRDLIAANPTLIEPASGGRFRLVAGADLSTATADVRRVLQDYEPAAVLGRALGAVLRFDFSKVEAIVILAGESLQAPTLAQSLRGDTPPDAIRNFIAAIRPLLVAFRAREWDAPVIAFVRQQPVRFGLTPPNLTVANLRALSVYVRLTRRRLGTAADAPLVDPADIRAALLAFNAAGPEFPATANDVVARVLGVSNGLVSGLRGRVALPAVAATALDALDSAAALASFLGLDGESLAALIRTDYASLERGAEALVTSIRGRYPDEAERAKQLSLVEEPLREKKRDALVAWHIHSLRPREFVTPHDLYAYFLIDVEAGGCSTTSRVVAATNSLQLYVHRILINLEQTDEGSPQPIALTMPSIAASEWTWRKNYRVWEANRKVFLWPENYIEPDLRDDRTPLFKELEDELLQTELSDQDVLDAYTKYMTGFEELASLTIAGAYHDVRMVERNTIDVLHLFGVASTDPPTYYYRTAQNLIASGRDPKQGAVWTPWRKINVQITSRNVCPVIFRGRLHVFWADYKTRPFNIVRSGESRFAGYRHSMSIRFTTLRPDGTWTPPQAVGLPFTSLFSPSRGMVEDNHVEAILSAVVGGTAALDDARRRHSEALDDYTLGGVNWLGLWPEIRHDTAGQDLSLRLRMRNFRVVGKADLFHRELSSNTSRRPSIQPPLLIKQGRRLKYAVPAVAYLFHWDGASIANLLIDDERVRVYLHELGSDLFGFFSPTISGELASLPEGMRYLALPGSIEDAILQLGPDVILLQGSVTPNDDYVLRRIGTTLVEDVSYKLFVDGVDGLLKTSTQAGLREAAVPLTSMTSRIVQRANAGKLDFEGAYGVYYREIFFHIPFLIANALNARGEFASAQRWYHHIFDPTATEVIDTTGLTGEEKKRRALDRVWRYIELRNLGLPRLRALLTDENALAVYRKDPFNPHAIARLRLSAYQKSIVMKYIDNLLDWADHLFTQFQMETVNEALMLYIMASDILGPRPAKLGDCGEGEVSPKTYENISATIGTGEEVLIELETWIYGSNREKWNFRPNARGQFSYDLNQINRARESVPFQQNVVNVNVFAGEAASNDTAFSADTSLNPDVVTQAKNVGGEAKGVFVGAEWNAARVGNWAPPLAQSTRKSGERLGRVDEYRGRVDVAEWMGCWHWSVVRQISPVFCIPANKDLLAYWNRVEDRLFKIRHCMDITGQKRELALFAPEIDPRLLVRMRAAGLSLDDVLGATSGNLPPYRFLFLVDRAKAFASTLSSYGAALLATLEKKDGEELNRLRLVQQQNLTRMSTQLRRWDIEIAEESVKSVERQLEAARYRRDYYDGLVQQNRTPAEIAESVLRHSVSLIQVTEAVIDTVSAITALIPQAGSPFAMKYGGVEIGTSLQRFGNAIHATSQGLSAIATSVGLEANYERRVEGWKHQRALAEHDIANLERQLEAANIRLEIAQRALSIHEKSIEQLQEMLEATDGKFSNFGLYTFLSTLMRRLYRDAYQNALALARLAEQAFRFERGDDTLPGLSYAYWDATHAGLLAGEQLLTELQSLERRYLETNYRELEIDQAFALSQIAPDALITLREIGECSFKISEVFFDLFYPGHYKRRIKAVRLTIPSITGPYVNVSATLTLDKSWIRLTPAIPGALVDVPPRRSVSVAISTAQNDAGVFELSFRDERYMPFEGAGAVSEWVLSLPKTFRQFDYQTINDVIISISYTAEQDGARRTTIEQNNVAVVGSLRKVLSENSIGRLFSLRQDFSSAFTRLLHSPAATDVRFEITDRHFPLIIGSRPINVTKAVMLLKLASGASTGTFAVSVDGTGVSGFTADASLGNLPAAALPAVFSTNIRSTHTLTLTNAGDLAPTPTPGDASALDADKLLDVLLYVEYRLTSTP